MVDPTDAAHRIIDKDAGNYNEICDTFKEHAAFTQQFMHFHTERDAFLEKIASKEPLSEKDEVMCHKIDTDHIELLRRAPSGSIHGYLVSLPLFNRGGGEDPLSYSIKSIFYQEDPQFFHKFATRFSSESASDFFLLREVLMNNSVFTDMLQLYCSLADELKEGDVENSKWLEGIYKDLCSILTEITLLSPTALKIKEYLIKFHQEKIIKASVN